MTCRVGKGALLHAVPTAPSLPPREQGDASLSSGRLNRPGLRPAASSGWTGWLCQPYRASMRSERGS